MNNTVFFKPILAIICMIVSVTFANAQPAPNAPPPTVTVAKPIVKTVTEIQEFTGRFDSAQTVEVRARVNGYLSTINFIDGAIVKKDDLLFTIDKRSYEASLKQAQATLSSKQSSLDFAKSDLDRANALGKSGNITEQTIGQRKLTDETAQADLRSAQAAIDTAKLNLEFTSVKAAIPGKISRKLITIGNLVAADTTLLTTIVSIDPINFYFDADERTYLSYLRTGLGERVAKAKSIGIAVQLTDEKTPMHKGFIDFVDNRIDSATGTIRLRAVLPNSDQFLTPGMFGKIYIPRNEPYKAVLIPDEAIAADLSRRIVMVVGDDGIVSTKAVQPGPKIDGYRVIREGLTGEETIIIAGIQRAKAGQKVTPQVQKLEETRQ